MVPIPYIQPYCETIGRGATTLHGTDTKYILGYWLQAGRDTTVLHGTYTYTHAHPRANRGNMAPAVIPHIFTRFYPQ